MKKWLSYSVVLAAGLILFALFFEGCSQTHIYNENGLAEIEINIIKRPNESHWAVEAKVAIAIDKATLWGFLSKPEYLNACHPYCNKNTVGKWPGVGSVDTINYYAGFIMTRTFIEWNEGNGYSLMIDRLDDSKGNLAKVTWKLADSEKGNSELLVSVQLQKIKMTPGLEWLYYKKGKYFSSMEKYLCALLRGIKFHLETGTQVERNQFGDHPNFSPAF